MLQKAQENYFEGKNKVAYVILVWPTDNYMGGTFLLTKWPFSDDVDLCFSPEAAGFSDLGTTVGSVSTEYFNLECIASLIKTMYETYVAE